MLNAYGWIIVRSSREKYQDISDEDIDSLDDETEKADRDVWDKLEDFLKILTARSSLLKTQFTRTFNNVSGHLSILVSRNHSAPELYELIEWIAKSAVGSYGIIYLHNDESAFSNQFRIIRINKGGYTEHGDQLLSPICPVIEYEGLP